MRTTIEMAHKVYGEHTFWNEAQLLRLKAFAELVRADERDRAAPVQEPYGYLFQHEETGLTTVVDVQQVEWGFEKNNPRHQKIGPVYTTPPVAQPAVPDAFGTREGEHPQYIQGWNDCRAEMLRGMKP